MSLRVIFGAFIVLFAAVSQGVASPIGISNPSFEIPYCGGTLDPVTCMPDSWTVYDPPGVFSGTFRPLSTAWDSIPDGVQVAFSNGGTLTQTLAATVAPNTTYTLSVWVSQRWSAGSFLPDIQLLAGSTPVIAMSNSNPGGAAPTTNPDGTYTWQDWIMSWTSSSAEPLIGQTLSIVLGSHALVGVDATQTDFDNVSLTANSGELLITTNPEPGMFVLVAGGLIGFGIRRRFVK
uniref:Ice-binding protein C-terminal domain-containing protein n=1 Tax=Solibacter usitatus (strain Ellin6076) TaxID=234267 RepID=Q01R59_SOLUE